MTTQRRIDELVVGATEELALITDKTAGAIYSELKSRTDLEGLKFSLKTIERIVKEIRPPQEKSEVWTLADGEGDDARTVLTVLWLVIRRSERQITYFSKDEADWVLRVSKAAPGLHPFRVWLLAKLYQGRATHQKLDTEALDAYIAFMPWVNSANLAVYKGEVSRGLKPVPMWDWIVEQTIHWSEEDAVTSIRTLLHSPWPLEIDDTDTQEPP